MLNGYWEISEANFKGQIKKFTVNPQVDYFMLSEDLSGYRKKLSPNFNGTFSKNKAATPFQIKMEHDSLFIYYDNGFNKWKESIVYIDSTSLKIINSAGHNYSYNRFKNFAIK